MNNKGNFADVVEYMRVALALGFVIVITLLFINNWGSNVRSMDNSTVPEVVKNSTVELETYTTNGFDYLFLLIYLVFLGFSVVMARLIPSSSKFILLFVFILILLPFASLIFENIWHGFITNFSLASIADNLTFLPFMLDHFVWFVTFYCLVVGIALLTKEEAVL